MCIILEFIFSKIKENLFIIFHLYLRMNHWLWNSPAIQWLGLCTLTAGGMALIPGWETKILQAAWYSRKIKKEKKNHGFKTGRLEDLLSQPTAAIHTFKDC